MSFSIIDSSDITTWNNIVKGFSQYDVYYLFEYTKAFEIHGDGKPLLIYYQNNSFQAIKVVMKREIQFTGFHHKSIYDLVTPYGYGGFILEGQVNKDSLIDFFKQYSEYLNNNAVISEFTRFHPVLANQEMLPDNVPILELGKTISIKLEVESDIWDNLTSKNRNMIRKAQKSGVTIKHGRSEHLFEKFMDIYNQTMDNDNASEYYYFRKEFYSSILNDLKDNSEIFYAEINNQIIAMSIILFANKTMHYHLSGSLRDFRNLAPTNLLLFEAAIWGMKHGFKTFHLGGGLGAAEDNLFKFKQAFNKTSCNSFFIGKFIYNEDIYNQLVDYRKKTDPNFNKDSKYFPLYRS